MLLKTKDTIFIKNEVRKSLVTNKNPSTKDIITHYVDKLKYEIQWIVNHKAKINESLEKEIMILKMEKQAIAQKIIEMKSVLTDLETQFGQKMAKIN